ncbi:MAG: serine/threonine protein kinase [Anaerolineales bacterium]|nr:serine/threonine protein kinase [Anaerolineales bacterium]
MDNRLHPGQMLGTYRIIEQIGEGGMASVYKAYQVSMDRNVAIKVLPGQLAESPEFVKRFQQEARIIARLEHPYILPVFDYGEENGIAYFVMRYLEAGTLKDKMQAGQLSLKEIDKIFMQLTDALGYAHGQGIVHRDLKPANVLVDSTGHIFLTDFGIAKLLESASPRLTQTDAILGTPAYISPEQAAAGPIDQRSDIYSLGVILYEMVAGRVPFVADTPLAVILKHLNEPLPLPSIVKPDIPMFVEQTIIKALAKDPKDRYATTAEFAAAWRHSLDGVGSLYFEDDKKDNAPFSGQAVSTTQTVSKSDASKTIIPIALGCLVVLCIVLFLAGGFGFATTLFTQPTATAIPTSTPAPTSTSAPAVSPTASITVLFKDDFSNQNEPWGLLSDADQTIEYVNDTLKAKLTPTNWFVWTRPNDVDYENVHIETTVYPNNSDQYTAFGLMCQQQADNDAYYYFVITPAGQYVIAKTKSGATDLFLTNNDDWAYSNVIPKKAKSYRIGADCASNGTLTLYVNDQKVDSVTDTSYTKGMVGVVIWSSETKNGITDVNFDDYLITAIK